jgi:hypothetical protein
MMYIDVLRSIGGIGVFPVISLLLFVAVFSGVLVWAWRTDEQRLSEFAALPLDDPRHSVTCPARRSGGDL